MYRTFIYIYIYIYCRSSRPWLIFTAGAMGSGKSHMLNMLQQSGCVPYTDTLKPYSSSFGLIVAASGLIVAASGLIVAA